MQFRPGKADPVTYTMADGSTEEVSFEEFCKDRALRLMLWRSDPQDGSAGIYLAQLYFLTHSPLPRDLQDWMRKCFELSRESKGKVSLDKAFGIKDPNEKQNAYNKRDTSAAKSQCVHCMEMLLEVCGVKGKKLAAEVIVAREKPEFNVPTLCRYYRDRIKLDGWEAALDDFRNDNDGCIGILESFLPTCPKQHRLYIRQLLHDRYKNLTLR